MVKSPVEGSTLVLLKLETPVAYSDFVRPVCLPDDDFTQNAVITDYQFLQINKGDEKIKLSNMGYEPVGSTKVLTYLKPRSISHYNDKTYVKTESNHQWKNCNSIGWSSRPFTKKDQLQRIQLNIIDMKACENISIATVNQFLCAEASYPKQDCQDVRYI